MKKLMSILTAALALLCCLPALALPRDDLPSHGLPFEQLVGDNGDYNIQYGDWPAAGTYRAVVDITNQVVTVYKTETDEIVRQCLASTGTKKDPTPLGAFVMPVQKRFRFRYFKKSEPNGGYGQYMTKIDDLSWFHSVLYDRQDANTYTGSYSTLGQRASHGCIRLPVPDARWIYFNLAPGTKVEITDKIKKDRELVKSLALPNAPKKRPVGLERVPQIFVPEEESPPA